MAGSKVAIFNKLAIILASALLLPAASAWQEKLRAANFNRICVSGALAIVTLQLPTLSVPQVQLATTSNATTNFDKTDPLDASCSTKQACVMQFMCLLALNFYVTALFVSLVISRMPDQRGDVCLLDDKFYAFHRCAADASLGAGLLLTLMACGYVVLRNALALWLFIPWIFALLMFVIVAGGWLCIIVMGAI